MIDNKTTYAYDALKRLTNVTFDSPTPETPGAAGVKSRSITLDKLDNILKITDNENAMVTEIVGELEGKGKVLNQYSRFNDLPLEHDKNGNLSAKGSRLFTYDYRNRLIRSSKGDDSVTFTYDIFGRQTSRTDLSGTYHFFYAGDQKIEERNASGQVTKQYVWGNGIDELLRLDIFNGSSSTPYYVHTDNIGSTTAITDGSGNLVERVTYDVYGVPTFTDALGQTLKKSTIRNTTLFQGREYDYDLAVYNYRARYLDPSLGRFLQPDPLGYQDSMNLYQGMGMNPVNFVDPWGEAKIRVFINKSSGEVLSQKSITIPQHWDDGKIVAARTITFPSRDWTALSKLAQEKGHSLEMIYNDSNQFQYQEFRKSIGADVANEEETWTFIISHSLEVTEECLNQFDEKSRPNIPKRAMSFGDNKDPYLGGAVFKLDEDRKLTYVKDTSDNSYIGFLGCRTNDVSKNFVYGKVGTFFIEGFGQDSDRYSAINAGYGVIEALITGKNPREAANIGTIMIRRYSEVLDLYNNKILKQHVPNSEVNYGHQIIYKKTK